VVKNKGSVFPCLSKTISETRAVVASLR